MQKERILAYQISKKLTEEDLKEISGSQGTLGRTGPHATDVFEDGDFA